MALLAFPLLVLAQNGPAKDEPAAVTAEAYNGTYWSKMPPAVKLGFLVGFGEAIRFSPLKDKFSFGHNTYGQMVRTLDEFYQRQEDLRMPIWMAISIAVMEKEGASDAQIQNRILEFGRPVLRRERAGE